MDDRHAYMMNELWTRQYDLGRVLRFRHVQHGRQAECYEVLTAEQQTYTAYLFPPAFAAGQLAKACETLGILDRERFTVVPMVATNRGGYLAEGPQGAAMVVGLEAPGQMLPAESWSLHDLTQLGLRLAWMHRLMLEKCPPEDVVEPSVMIEHLQKATPGRRMQTLKAEHLAALAGQLAVLPLADGWVHGDVQPAAMLLDDDRQIRTVVDWGLLHLGDPLEDVIDAFVHWCMTPDGVVNAEAGRALIESYRTLRALGEKPWERGVMYWCFRRYVDAMHDRRGLPRGFATVLAEPRGLAGALEMCATK